MVPITASSVYDRLHSVEANVHSSTDIPRVGIAQVSPQFTLDVTGTANVSGALTTQNIVVPSATLTNVMSTTLTSSTATLAELKAGQVTFSNASGSATFSQSDSLIGLNTDGPPKYSLDVAGSARSVGTMTARRDTGYSMMDFSSNNFDVTAATTGLTHMTPLSPLLSTEEGSVSLTTGNYVSFVKPVFQTSWWLNGGFTLEAWVNYGKYPTHVDNATFGSFNNGGTKYWEFGMNNSGLLSFGYYPTSTIYNREIVGTTPMRLNTWYHIAVTYDTSQLRLYLNGSLEKSSTLVNTNTPADITLIQAFALNHSSVESLYVGGVRLVYGAALGTSTSYPVPTGPLSVSATGTTALLLRMPQNNKSYTLVDKGISAYNLRTVFNGSKGSLPAVPASPFSSQYNEGSLFFSNTTNITLVHGYPRSHILTNWSTSGGFTMECWVKYPSFAGVEEGTNIPTTFGNKDVSFGPNLNSKLCFQYTNQSIPLIGTTTMQVDTWYHIAMTCDTQIRIFLNGTLENSAALAAGTPPPNGNFNIGQVNGFHVTNVYVTNLRVVSGAALHDPSTLTYPVPLVPLERALKGTTTFLLRVPQDAGRLTSSSISPPNTPITKEYPPAALSADTTALTASYGSGTYIASSSGLYEEIYAAFYAFDKSFLTLNPQSVGVFWASAGPYDKAAGTYTGVNSTTDDLGRAYLGDWLQIRMPTPIVLKSYVIVVSDWLLQSPGAFVILGSNDSVMWTCIDQRSDQTWSAISTGKTYTLSSTSNLSFTTYRLVATKRCIDGGSGTGIVTIGEWTLNGSDNEVSYPPAAMTDYLTNIQSTTYGKGTYIASTSGEHGLWNGRRAWHAFGRVNYASWWASLPQYSIVDGSYTGTTATCDTNGNTYKGEWLQLQLPTAIKVSSFTLGTTTNPLRSARIFYVLGSKDGVNWKCITSKTTVQTSWTVNSSLNFRVNSSSSYQYFRFIPNAVFITDGVCSVSELTFYGQGQTINLTDDGQVGIGLNRTREALEVAGNMTIAGNIGGAGNIGSFRNRVINGDMRINQRGLSTLTVINDAVGHFQLVDTFGLYSQTNGSTGLTLVTLVTTDTPYQFGFAKSLRFTTLTQCTTGYAIPTKCIEGSLMSDFMWGTSFGLPATLSFWIKSNVAVVPVQITNDNSTSTYITNISVNSGVWQYVAIKVPAPPAGSVWSTTTGKARIDIGPFSTMTTTMTTTTMTDKWFSSSASSLNIFATLGNYVEFTGVQFEKGPLATPFEFRPFATELQMCQRYYETSFVQGTVLLTGNSNSQVTLYTGDNFTGTSASLGIGSYDITGMGIPNDSLRSITIPAGLAVTLYDSASFRSAAMGALTLYAGDVLPDGFKNVVSSFRIFSTVNYAPILPGAIVVPASSGPTDSISQFVPFKVPKIRVPIIQIYNPYNANNNVREWNSARDYAVKFTDVDSGMTSSICDDGFKLILPSVTTAKMLALHYTASCDFFNEPQIQKNPRTGLMFRLSATTLSKGVAAGSAFTTWSDEMGLYNGTTQGSTYLQYDAVAKYHYVDFTGSNYVSLPSLTLSMTQGFTAVIVARFNGVNNWERLFDFGNGEINDNILLARSGTSQDIGVELNNGGTVVGSNVGINAIVQSTLNIWTLVVDNIAIKIYKNGILLNTTTSAASLTPRTLLYNHIGKANFAGRPLLVGRVADFDFYDTVLDDSALATTHAFYMSKYAIPAAGLMFRLSASNLSKTVGPGTAFTTWGDSLGTYNGTSIGSTYLQYDSLLKYHYVDFTGTNYMTLPSLTLSMTQGGFTAVIVARFNGLILWERLFDFGNGTDSDNIFLARMGTSQDIQGGLYNGATNVGTNVGINAIVQSTLNIWTLVVDNIAIKLYKNGILLNTTTSAASLTPRTTINNYIGKSNFLGDGLLVGRIADFDFYDVPLGDAQLATMHAQYVKKYGLPFKETLNYPPTHMTANTSIIEGQPYGNGTYVSSASSTNPDPTAVPWASFGDGNKFGWTPVSSDYAPSTGNYNGTVTTTLAVHASAVVNGEWLQIKLPAPITPTGFTLNMSWLVARAPKTFTLLASNDGTAWYDVGSHSNVTFIESQPQTFAATSSIPYSYYRLVVTQIAGGDSWLSIYSMNILGQ